MTERDNFQITIEEPSPIERKVKVEIPRESYDSRFTSQLIDYSKHAHIKGFRPGRAPRAIIAKQFGDNIRQAVLKELFKASLDKVMDENQFWIVGPCKIASAMELDKEVITFEITFSLMPEPNIENYKGLSIEVKVLEYREELLEQEIEHLRRSSGQCVEVEGKDIVEEGDYVVVKCIPKELQGSDSEIVEEKTIIASKDKSLLGTEGGAFDELSKALAGHKLKEKLTFMKKISSDVTGSGTEEVQYCIAEIHKIAKMDLPKLDDEFANMIGFPDGMKDMRRQLAQYLQKNIEHANHQLKEYALFDKLLKENPFDVPIELVDDLIRKKISHILSQYDSDKVIPENLNLEKTREYFFESMQRDAKIMIIFRELLKKEEFELSKEEFELWLNAKRNSIEVDLGKETTIPYDKESSSYQEAITEKLTTWLLEQSKIKEIPINDSKENIGE